MKKKMNDKGFSLVELIIVVAIMAILIGLLAPQYLKFVERSRKSADRDTVDNVIRAVQIDQADPEDSHNVNGAKITITSTGATIADVTTTGAGLKSVLDNANIDLTTVKLKSSKWVVGKDGTVPVTDVVISFANDGDNVKATVTANATTSEVVDGSNVTIEGIKLE